MFSDWSILFAGEYSYSMSGDNQVSQGPSDGDYGVPASRYSLDSLFTPRSAVLLDGQGDVRSVAEATWKNIIASFSRGKSLRIDISDGLDVSAIPEHCDLAVIVAPPEEHEKLILACDSRRVRMALVMTDNHREPGDTESDRASWKILFDKLTNGIRILGPQSYGLIVPRHDLNITPLLPMPRAGNIACISQSGALSTAVLDWSFRTGMGFSAVVTSGVMEDIDWGDLITYFGDDPYTKSIVIYLETMHDARSFLSAAREVALSKPIIVLKAGRTAGGAAIAAAHSHGDGRTDSLFDAALQRVGVLRVRTLAELFYMANILATQPLPRGPRLAIITNAIGPAIMATDSLLDSGGQLAELTPDAIEKLREHLPHVDCCENPVDIMGDATPEIYAQATSIVARQETIDGLLIILTPQQVTRPTDTARQVVEVTRKLGKPVLASWMGGDRVSEGQNILYDAGIPAFPYSDTPARLFSLMWRQARNLDAIYETPTVIAHDDRAPADTESVRAVFDRATGENRLELTEWESMAVLRTAGIPVVEVVPAICEDEAVAAAALAGYPVALKLLCHNHELKSAVSGVRLNLRSEQDVRDGFRSIQQSVVDVDASRAFLGVTVQKMAPRKGLDLVAGTRIDPQFGPYLYVGTGGQISEILNDHALGLPPLTTALAQRMIERTRMWKAMNSWFRADAPFLLELQSILVRLGQLVVMHPTIREIEINPLLATENWVVALDARISLFPAGSELPRPAIRPYPHQYTWRETLRDKSVITIRPVRPEDEPLIVEFHKKLSEETIYRRYMFQHKLSRRTSHARLRRTCFLDFDREIALAAVQQGGDEQQIILAVGRMARNRSGETAEIALVVADPYQGKGLGTSLLRHLVDIARAEGITVLEGSMLPDNLHMQHLFRSLGFKLDTSRQDGVTARLVV